jgi:hypothetical protein
MTEAFATEPAAPPERRGVAAVVLLALLGAAAVWLLALPAPATPGLARIRTPGALLAVLDTVWVLAMLVPRGTGFWDAVVRLAVPAPFHVAIASAGGAGPGFHAAFALVALAAAAVGALGVRVAPRVHGAGVAALCVALPLAAYAAGDFGGHATAPLLAASPLVGPAMLARGATTASAGDALPALAALAVLLAADLIAARRAGRTA